MRIYFLIVIVYSASTCLAASLRETFTSKNFAMPGKNIVNNHNTNGGMTFTSNNFVPMNMNNNYFGKDRNKRATFTNNNFGGNGGNVINNNDAFGASGMAITNNNFRPGGFGHGNIINNNNNNNNNVFQGMTFNNNNIPGFTGMTFNNNNGFGGNVFNNNMPGFGTNTFNNNNNMPGFGTNTFNNNNKNNFPIGIFPYPNKAPSAPPSPTEIAHPPVKPENFNNNNSNNKN